MAHKKTKTHYVASAYYDDNCRGLASTIVASDASFLEEFIWEMVQHYVVVVKNYETGAERKYTYESVMGDSDCPEIVLP